VGRNKVGEGGGVDDDDDCDYENMSKLNLVNMYLIID
jgi:hypothetical protein